MICAVRRLLALLAALLAITVPAFAGEPATDERLVQLRSERSALQARAADDARLALFLSLRIAGFLTDALSALACRAVRSALRRITRSSTVGSPASAAGTSAISASARTSARMQRQ